ncbi:hypothetical protein BH09MYX1_BH09MYX1_31060 [soil metagenome]
MKLARAGTFLVASALTGCALTSDFSGYDPIPNGTRPTHVVGGTVSGLGTGLKVTLSLNGTSAEYQDGTFSFADVQVPEGDPYEVTVTTVPPAIHCVATQNAGTIAAKNVDDVVVACTSDDASLVDLSVNPGAVRQTDEPTLGFATGVTTYFAWIYSYAVATAFGAPIDTTTITATAARSDATITIGDASAAGTLATDVAVPQQAGITNVVVRSSSGKSKTYAINLERGAYTTFDNGRAVSMSGDVIAVGDYVESSKATGIDGDETDTTMGGAGAVRIYRRNAAGSFVKEAYVKASNTRALAFFGAALALDGDTLAVGSPTEGSAATGTDGNGVYDCDTNVNCNVQSGAVYVFERTNGTWAQTAYLKSTGAFIGNLGKSIALRGDTLAVGQPGDEIGTGAVVIFKRANGKWTEASHVTLPGGTYSDSFGLSIALSDDTVVAGAPSDFFIPISGQITGIAGKVGVFKLSTTGIATYDSTLTASLPRANSIFGSSVAIAGTTIVVGAVGEFSNAVGIGGSESATGAVSSGAAYVFVKQGNAWVKQAYLKASNSRANAHFGAIVSILGDVVAIGSPGESSGTYSPSDTSAARSGAIYLLKRSGSTWSETAYLKSTQPAIPSEFGTQIWLSGTRLATASVGSNSWIVY